MIDHPYKELFYQPSVNKQWLITGAGINITNSDIDDDDGITIEESLCSQERLMFGSCEASNISFTVHGVNESLKGRDITVSLILNGDVEHILPIGTYRIEKDTPTADRKFRKITAHDMMYYINNDDVTYWYDHLTFPITVKNLRDSFFNHFRTQIIQETVTLPNDDILINKTINSDYGAISGNTIISAICEMNGCFGHMGRDGLFHYVFLKEIIQGLYPANDLYPADDLYPVDDVVDGKILMSSYRSIDYEDYECQRINQVTVINDEGGVLAVIGSGDNNYYMNNPLLYDKTQAQIITIVNRILNFIFIPYYWACEIEAVGNLCMEVGDSLRINTRERLFYTYILQRTLTGSMSLSDTYIAEGEEYRTERINSVSAELMEGRALASDAQNSADRAEQSADRAETTSASALSQAQSAAQTAQSAAQTAQSASQTAQSAAQQAQSAASTASSASQTAQSAAQQATNAVNTANSANTTAGNASNTANSANTTAGSALSTAQDAVNIAASKITAEQVTGTLITSRFQNAQSSQFGYIKTNTIKPGEILMEDEGATRSFGPMTVSGHRVLGWR